MEKNFPELTKYKCVTSRVFSRKEKSSYMDDWWFKFFEHELDDATYIVLAGAKDESNQEFQVFKVPTSFLKSNLHKLDMTDSGWINIYLHVERFEDVRNDSRLSFRTFAIN